MTTTKRKISIFKDAEQNGFSLCVFHFHVLTVDSNRYRILSSYGGKSKLFIWSGSRLTISHRCWSVNIFLQSAGSSWWSGFYSPNWLIKHQLLWLCEILEEKQAFLADIIVSIHVSSDVSNPPLSHQTLLFMLAELCQAHFARYWTSFISFLSHEDMCCDQSVAERESQKETQP